MKEKKICIGITICLQEENESIWINGIKQNAIFLARTLMNSEKNYDVYIVNISDIKITNNLGWDINKYKTVQFNEIKDKLDLFIMLGGTIVGDDFNYLKNRGCKIVSYKCGNDYIISMENILFNARENMRPVYNNVDEVWIIPQMENTNSEYWRVFFRTNVVTIPFVWNPMFLDDSIQELISKGINPFYKPSNKPKRISVFEPNINVYKFLMYPMLIAEDVYRINPELIEVIRATNTTKVRTHPELVHLMMQLDIVKDNKASFEDRFSTPWFLSNYTDIVLSHQWENALNYAYLDAVYMKYPLVHNAHLFKDAGYYYEGFNISEGREKLLYALKEHDNNLEEYEEKSKKIIHKYSSDNMDNVRRYDELIEKLLKKKNKIILTEKPVKEYHNICIESIKNYCNKYNYDFNYIDEYKYDKTYTHIIYINNESLILNQNIDIKNFINDKIDIINLGNYNNIMIIKNDIKNDLYKIIENKIRYYILNNNISISENDTYNQNDSLENELFLNKIKKSDKDLIFISSRIKDETIKNYIYNTIYNKIYFNKSYLENNTDFNNYLNNEDFECFNPNKEIAFVTLYTKEILDEGKEMEYNLKKYCEKNNYTFYIHRKSELEGKRHPCFEKPYLLKKYLEKHKYVIWVDSDIVILDMVYKIENLLNDNFDLISFKDYGENYNYDKINSGILIFKNSLTSIDIINNWIKDIETKNAVDIHGPTHGDQGILNDLIINYPNKYIIKNNNEINTPLDFLNKNTKIIHFMGLYGFIRHLILKYFNHLTIKNK